MNGLDTTIRDEDFLKWKFNDFKTNNYESFKINNGNMVSYIVTKRLKLIPTSYYATKIIDIYGEIKELKIILNSILKKCHDRGIYL